MIKKLIHRKIVLRTIIIFSLFFPSILLFSNTIYHSKTNEIQVNKVYVCSGKYATKFHSVSNCKGLNNCKGTIYSVENQNEAIKLGYTHCLLCWK